MALLDSNGVAFMKNLQVVLILIEVILNFPNLRRQQVQDLQLKNMAATTEWLRLKITDSYQQSQVYLETTLMMKCQYR